jgi:Leucine-rich repeat (LRR) protein
MTKQCGNGRSNEEPSKLGMAGDDGNVDPCALKAPPRPDSGEWDESDKILWSAPPPIEREQEEVRKKREWWVYITAALMLITTTVGLGCVVFIVFGAANPQIDYYEELQLQVVGLSDDPSVLDEPSSSQSLALDWLANNDEARVNPQDTARVQARYSLAVLYFATHGATQWIDQLKFLSPEHECEWNDGVRGVFCDQSGVIEDLKIASNNLRGSLPVELSTLTALQTMWLQDNRITGTIPSFSFPILENFRLDKNVLEGTVPSSLTNMPQLRILDLSANQLQSGLPLELKDLQKLEILNLGGNQLSGSGSDVVLSNLRQLNLTANKFQGDLDFLKSLSKMQVVDLSENEFQANLAFEKFSTMTDLVTMDLSGNRIVGPIPSSLGRLTNLSYLNVARNLLTGTFPWFSFSDSQLKQIIMTGNFITGALPLDIFRFTQLETVNFDRNRLSGNLPLGLGGSSSLRSFRAAGNAITGTFPPSLGNLKLLVELDISDNSFTGPLPESLTNLSSLEFFDIHDNGFTGTVPPGMETLDKVSRIALQGNDLTGTIDFLCSIPSKPIISADCASSEPEVLCTCCDICLP